MNANASSRESARQPATNDGTWKKSWCAMCLQNDCGMLVRMENGVVTETAGDPDTPTNRGKLCMRGGLACIPGYYDPKRIKTPLRRTNPNKGLDVDPGWEAISWDEAYSLIGAKLKEIRAKDPRRMAYMEGWGVCDELFSRETNIVDPETGIKGHGCTFTHAFGTPNNCPSHGVLCTIHFATGLVHAQLPEQIADLEYCAYLIAPGRTVGSNSACPHSTARLTKALDRGMKLVVVDPRHSPEASKAHRWLPIVPGTELAFNLAMLHGILFEVGVYDVKFLKDRTNAPYLIGADGLYARDAATDKPRMIDASDNTPKPFDQVADPVLDAELVENGETIKTGFRLFREGMKNYTPEWAEKICTVPASEIRAVTKEFVEHACIGQTITIDGFEFPFRPVQYNCSGRGACTHRNGTHADIAGKLVNLLMGAIELPGACTGGSRPGPNANILRPDQDGTVTPTYQATPNQFHFPPVHIDGSDFFPHKHTAPPTVVRNILDPKRWYLDYDIDLWFFAGANPIRSTSDPDLWVQAMRKVPMVVSINIIHDESTALSDIVLPTSHFLEKEGIRIYKPPLQSIDDDLRGLEMILARNTVPRLHDTKNADQILYDLAEAGGFLPEMNDCINMANRLPDRLKLDLNKRYELEDIWDRLIANIFGDEHTYKSVQATGQIWKYSVKGKEAYNYYYWPGNTTRHSFYIERLPRTVKQLRENFKKAGVTHPVYKENQEKDMFAYYTGVPFWYPTGVSENTPPEFDLYVMNWKTSFRIHGTGGNMGNPWSNEMRAADPYEMYVHMNSITAKKKNLSDGQTVWIESPQGKTKGRIRVTELIHPQVIGIPGNYGGVRARYTNPVMPEGGAWFNCLLGYDEVQHIDPIAGGMDNAPRVKVYPA